MITTRKLWELFEAKWVMMRQNPGGKSAYLQGYLLGFAGTVDISGVIDPETKKGRIKLKVGNKPAQIKDIDFSGIDVTEVTPSEAADLLQRAGFEGCVFGIDFETRRLKLAPSDDKIRLVQIYGDLAGAFNFGNCRSGEGKGCYLWASMDGDLKSVAETEKWSEDKEIKNESPLGNDVTYTKPGKRGGTQIVVTDRLSSREAKQMINGGIWKSGDPETPEEYEPPVAGSDDTRRVDVFTFSDVFDKNNNTAGDELFVRERMYIGGVGHMTRTGGAGNWTDSEYTLTFGTYTGDDKKEHASPKEKDYTQAQYEAYGLSGVLEPDWDDGMGTAENLVSEDDDPPDDELPVVSTPIIDDDPPVVTPSDDDPKEGDDPEEGDSKDD